MDAKGIILELQWKKKYAIRNGGDDISSIGVCYMAEPSVDLDWISFKSYLCQNVGTKEDVTFAYVDSEGDEIPIESECEFQEVLKFARKRARQGRAIVLKLDRPRVSDTCIVNSQTEKPPLGAAKTTKAGASGQNEIQKNMKPFNANPFSRRIVTAVRSAKQTKREMEHSEATRDDSPPFWFEKEKEKMKNEIVMEVTSQIAREFQQAVVEMKKFLHSSERTPSVSTVDTMFAKKKKKKVSDEELSDANTVEQRSGMDAEVIILDLQWKKKYAIRNGGDDIASIGEFYIREDSFNLDWTDFKSFLCQTLGTEEDVTFAYVDSEGDEIPIESECEFQEARKFARKRARQERAIVLKLDRPPVTDTCIVSSQTEKPPLGVAAKTTKPGAVGQNEMQKNVKPFNANPSVKTFSPMQKARSIVTAVGSAKQTKREMEHSEATKDGSPPFWFEKEKEKMKNEIVTEVTSQITCKFQQAIVEMKKTLHSSDRTPSVSTVDATYAKKKKKKVSDEESSDANAVEQRESKLLRKIEKLQKREKKLEKKLDSKLEKLENRTKRMLEKKSHSKSRTEALTEQNTSTRKRADVPVGTYLMDAVLLNGGSKPDAHIKLGESFTKVWQIMNTGTLPWTDKTELRLAWGTTGLEPQVTTVKCPALEPGERGQICVTFKAPEFSGTFESYWHFYHMGVRFGHWISCAVIVEPKEENEAPYNNSDGCCATDICTEDFDAKSRNDHAVDLTVRSKSEEIGDLEVITKCEKLLCNSGKDNENCRDGEYESDTDSDNLSVISNGVSVSSESEEDNFVVVSMPASSTTEGNLFVSGDSNITELSYPELIAGTMTTATTVDDDTSTVTTTTTTEKSSSAAATISSNVPTAIYPSPRNTDFESAQGREYNEVQVEVKPSSSGASEEKVSNLTHCSEAALNLGTNLTKSQFEEEEIKNFSQKDGDQPLVDLTHTLKNNANLKNIVFAVDMQGRTVPVKVTNRPRKQNVNIPSSQSSGSYPDVCPISVEDSEEVHPDPENASSNDRNDFRSEMASQYTSSSETSQSANGKYGVHDSYAESGGNIIHILPETLMNGAVNVATSAISTARAVISNLRTIPSRTSNSSAWEAGSSADSAHPSIASQSMTVLLDMGFTNKELNLLLLKRHNNDISKVVSELLSHAEENSPTI